MECSKLGNIFHSISDNQEAWMMIEMRILVYDAKLNLISNSRTDTK